MRKKIFVMALCWTLTASVAGMGNTFAQTAAPSTSSGFVKNFQTHWTTAKELAIAVAQAMPEADYGFKPTPEEMSFGQQITHIAQANYGYCAFVRHVESPYLEPAENAKVEKAKAIKELGESFDYCSETIAKLTDAELDKNREWGGHTFGTREVVLGVMIHMVHHRGQAEVYLRLKGIVPPKYKW